MKQTPYAPLLILSILFMLFSCQEETQSGSEELRVTTINIKWDNPNEGNNRWDLRKYDLVNYLQYQEAQVIGLQEALYHQLLYLDSALTKHAWVGVGRDAGDMKGEFCPILVDTTLFSIEDSGTFWLSETPNVPSKAWDAALPRIATYVQLVSKSSNQKLFALNTHFDHVGDTARAKSMHTIQEQVRQKALHDQVVIMGDFNLEPHSTPIQSLIAEGWQDCFESAAFRFGPDATFNGYNYQDPPKRRIDYVFASPQLNPKKYATESALIDGRYLSDHFPVSVLFEWN